MRRFIALLAVMAGVFAGGAQASFAATEVVVLGDSFAAGEGADNKPGFIPEPSKYYAPGQLTTCKRSSQAAGNRLASELNASVKFVACAGAKVDNVLRNGLYGEPAQVTALSTSTDIATLVVGGNNIGFGALVQRGLTGTLSPTSPEVVAAQSALNSSLPSELDALFADIKTRIGSGTKVLVLGYPYLPPRQPEAVGLLCAAYLTSGERDVVISLESQLNATIASAVNRASDARITFLDPTAPSSPFLAKDPLGIGRDACNVSGYNAFNTLRFGIGDHNNIMTVGAFHPNIWGQYYYLQMLRPYAVV